jgi:hypothetical protein
MTDKIKAIRKLSNFNFEKEGSAVALVHVDQGGPANNVNTLVFKSKSTESFTNADVEKATKVTVTMNIVDYLSTFFDLWWDDAEILARVMGYDTTVDEETNDYWDNWINSQVAAVTIMKSLVVDKEQDEIYKSVSELSPQDYLTIIKSQEIFEKNFEKVASLKKSSSVIAEGVTAPQGAISPSVDLENNKEVVMTDIISKAAHQTAVQEAIEKAVAPLQAELQKAQELIKQHEVEKAAVIAKSRKDAIKAVEADEAAAEELFKSLEGVSDVAFEGVLKALKKKEDKVENSDIMKEVGTAGREINQEAPAANRTMEILKAQFQTQAGAK